ncbi:helix-turn-helix domain-containing protein [Aquimarina sp. 2201CG14-23]|uniref:helix-turn-helix domain-containing protein n=1 Tax=Aquimarina mycalae TaxID=3040073 RepID=UPI002477E2F9|nr:helix-turn-helix domain-containing protein [Aquimarina sp. 2201CG14-23]MDH7445265.1 helix-turn-helix domain-containing protein [Aquimarina sp. 2201CG14-23]
MEQDKPYLNHELRLDDLAQKFTLSRHHMSQVINEQFDLSFFDFVNQYRVEEAKKMIIKNDHLTINEILYSCGFNNRVSFYKAFRKISEITPSEYRSLNRLKREVLD